MKDNGNILQQAYFDLLSGQITGEVYDTVPSNVSYPYTQIDSRTATDYTDNTSLGQEVTQTLWVVDRFSGSFGSRDSIYTITDEIMQIVRSRPNAFDLQDFNVVTTTLDIANFDRQRTDTHTYIKMEIRFRHLIEQL